MSSNNRITRRNQDDALLVDNDIRITPAPSKRTRVSPRNWVTCFDIKNLPDSLLCSGCSNVRNSSSKKPRSEYKSPKYKCFEGWKKDSESLDAGLKAHVIAIKTWISNNENVNCDEAFIAPEPKKGRTMITPRTLLKTPPPTAAAATTTTSTNAIKPKVVTTSTNEYKRPLNFRTTTIKCNGRELSHDIPNNYELVISSQLRKLENRSDVLRAVCERIQSCSYTPGSIMSQTVLSIAMSSVPALAFSAAAYLFPLFLYAFFYDTGLFKKNLFKRQFQLDEYVTSFPSDWMFRKLTMHQATRDTLHLGEKLVDKRIYIACDKGNKKGVGHFVKYLSWWDPKAIDANGSLCVQTQLLDIDASGGTSLDCAKAIQASMNKLKTSDESPTHLVYGQCTDSGGGGVLDSLADEMRNLGLLWLHNYLVANCTIHALQLQLRNAVNATFGAGGLDKVNAMQLLHLVYALQESLDLDEWRHILIKSSQYVSEYDPTAQPPEVDAAALTRREQVHATNKEEFQVEFDKIYKYHSKFKTQPIDPEANYTGTLLQKMTQPILTRWWTVGAAASTVFDYYLQIFHACQTVVNVCGSESSPYKIASTLYSMMKDLETFIDVTRIRCFNKVYLHPHLDWLQKSDDLSGTLGFQSHQIVIRYFCMRHDLCHLMSSTTLMKDYFEAIQNCGSESDNARHRTKLDVFMKEAIDCLEKHFKRWIAPALLPAALLAEEPIARVVGAVILGREFPSFESSDTVTNGLRITGRIDFVSAVHNRRLCLKQFDKFLRERIEVDAVYNQEANVAATMAVDRVDLRSFDYEGPNGTIRFQLHSAYLHLPSQTQFVESGVKEAKNVSSTDRSEELRSALAVIRSATPLARVKKGDASYNSSKILALIQSAHERSDPHEQWIRNQVDSAYDPRFNTILCGMSPQGHYRESRVDSKKTRVDNDGEKYKKQNAIQQKHVPQHQTPAVTGLIPHGKITTKGNGHMDGLEVELCHQGVAQEDIPKKITARKERLKQLEIQRLVGAGVPQNEAESLGKKHFKVLSTFQFQFVDD